MDWLLAPFHFPFMQNAFLAAALIVPPTALLSCLLVLKGWSLMGDAISHATLPGIVIAYVAGLPLVLGAFAAGMACALAVGFLGDNSRVKRDTVMGVVFSGMFGLGIVLYTWTETDLHLDHILFGNILGIGREDLWTAAAVALVVTAALLAKRRDLLLCAFDAAQAGAALDRAAGKALAEGGIVQRRESRPAPGRHGGRDSAVRSRPGRTCSRGRRQGNRRSHRCGCPAAAAVPGPPAPLCSMVR
jgi:hypothetical protein